MTSDPGRSQSIEMVSMAGTCDPELHARYMTGGMALSTDNCNTTAGTWTLSNPVAQTLPGLPKLPAARPVNQSLKNVSPYRVQRRRKKNRQARKASRK